MTTTPLGQALADAGGVDAAGAYAARLRALLLDELAYGADELERTRSGYHHPVGVGIAARRRALAAACPVEASFRADPAHVGERAWLLLAAVVGALVEVTQPPPPSGPDSLTLAVAALDGWLVLEFPVVHEDPAELVELAALALVDQAEEIDRLRVQAYPLPPHALDGTTAASPPIGSGHPLRSAEAIARVGGRPADRSSVTAHEDAVLELLQPAGGPSRPHDDPDPDRRIARRLLQRLAGMGKWGGYHTDVAHLPRGFQTHERARVLDIAQRLIDAGLLIEKTSVGQRHVHLNPRRAGDIYALTDRGELPAQLKLR